tara:strand:+ start:1868 stop:1996 length:129 start_codon:yes stop_codon:yes gene_type:complete
MARRGRMMKTFNIYEISKEDICCTIGVDYPPYALPIECDCEK